MSQLNMLRPSTIYRSYPRGIRSAVTSEFHPSTIVPTYGAGRAGGVNIEQEILLLH